jgi:hypothetical protein
MDWSSPSHTARDLHTPVIKSLLLPMYTYFFFNFTGLYTHFLFHEKVPLSLFNEHSILQLLHLEG